MRNIGLEIKIILSVIFFTLLVVGIERYELSENMLKQFVASKKAKNELLVETILPIVSLNISLGLEGADKEYLNLIIVQNPDIEYLRITNENNETVFKYPFPQRSTNVKMKNYNDVNIWNKPIVDRITNKRIGDIYIEFSNRDYEDIVRKNRNTTFEIFLFTVVMLAIFIYFLKKEFKHLRVLAEDVLAYDPKINSLKLQRSSKLDEVGVIHNAIITMVERIHSHTRLLDELNSSLEEKVRIRTKELTEANQKLEKLAIIDPLTNISNRRDFERHFQEMYSIAVRDKKRITIIMSDIDHFKNINDTYGHIIGDEVLKKVAMVLRSSLKRSTDIVARYGGEEFIILLYDTDEAGAKNLCESIQRKLKEKTNYLLNGFEISTYTMSFGISTFMASEDIETDFLIGCADKALYEAKESGRNKVVIYKKGEGC